MKYESVYTVSGFLNSKLFQVFISVKNLMVINWLPLILLFLPFKSFYIKMANFYIKKKNLHFAAVRTTLYTIV